MENLKKIIENLGYTLKFINQYKVLATKNNLTITASCIQVLAIKLGL
jgi:hypothetical protein